MASSGRQALRIRIDGIVQGVGFRPFVYRLARELELAGWVRNTSGAVVVHAEGSEEKLAVFLKRVSEEAPPLSLIQSTSAMPVTPEDLNDFRIEASETESQAYQAVPPDIATCSECLAEMRDSSDPRYAYPFINCTNCGPRYSIIKTVPYDRANTTMAAFPMCELCHRQYEDPSDRRFHAQPVACPQCGPRVWLSDGREPCCSPENAIVAAAELLRQGRILALKGVGGFHLAVDAANDEAVQELRRRKHRPHKSLALMMPDMEMVKRYCSLTPLAQEMLVSPASPITILPKLPEGDPSLSTAISPDTDTLGVMLPYTPLHHLLLEAVNRPLVMTSGNISEEPLATENEEAMSRLGKIADAFLLHDRPIHMPIDDSVVSTIKTGGVGERLQSMRRARGFAPLPVVLPVDGPQVLAVGAELKATACVARDTRAFLSQHIGDLSNVESWSHYLRVVAQFQELFSVEPELIAHDLHPDYLTTAYAREMAAERSVPLIAVQQHYAHALSCLVENGVNPVTEAVLAVAFDGTAYGDDGHIWGGEWLLLEGTQYVRVAHLGYLPIAGGEAGIRHVDQLAAGYLHALGISDMIAELPALAHLGSDEMALIDLSLKAPSLALTSSMGRLFDVIAAMLGLVKTITYEGQAAIRLETLAGRADANKDLKPYSWSLCGHEISVSKMIETVASDVIAATSTSEIAYRFHLTVADMVVEVCRQAASKTGAKRVALSGGCFQNALLSYLCETRLRSAGLHPLTHRLVPPNDGGVALGQAAAARLGHSPNCQHLN